MMGFPCRRPFRFWCIARSKAEGVSAYSDTASGSFLKQEIKLPEKSVDKPDLVCYDANER